MVVADHRCSSWADGIVEFSRARRLQHGRRSGGSRAASSSSSVAGVIPLSAMAPPACQHDPRGTLTVARPCRGLRLRQVGILFRDRTGTGRVPVSGWERLGDNQNALDALR
jgi:hypothetical protein